MQEPRAGTPPKKPPMPYYLTNFFGENHDLEYDQPEH